MIPQNSAAKTIATNIILRSFNTRLLFYDRL